MSKCWITLAVALFAVACTGSDAETEERGPHPHDFVLMDGQRYEKNPDVSLRREYWIVVAAEDGSRFMLPRPDGDPRVVEECRTNGPLAPVLRGAELCASATAATLSRVNALTASEAMQVSTFLHQRLRFVAKDADSATGPARVEPYPLTSDLLDVCKTFPAERSGVLRSICDEELRYEKGGARPSIGRIYSIDETRAIAARLNELYGIADR